MIFPSTSGEVIKPWPNSTSRNGGGRKRQMQTDSYHHYFYTLRLKSYACEDRLTQMGIMLSCFDPPFIRIFLCSEHILLLPS